MPGSSRTAAQNEAYRASFSMERLVEEASILVIVATMAITGLAGFLSGRTFPLLFCVGGVSAHLLLPPLLRWAMPRSLRDVLPAKPTLRPAPGVPRTYRQLFSVWFSRS